tara:strand:+ start:269 stop:493 length:225 start_codon:yes stop_codon:yes gene_type:complete
MILNFFNKIIKHYIEKLVDWMRMVKFDLELESQIKKYHDSFDKKKEPKIREVGKFGDDGWSISIGDIDDQDTKD